MTGNRVQPPTPQLSALYSPMVLEHGRGALRRQLSSPTHRGVAANRFCGDRIALALRIENGVVDDAAFDGRGCSLSLASASLLALYARGRTESSLRGLLPDADHLLRDADRLSRDADRLSRDAGRLEETYGEQLAALLRSVERVPARRECVELAWLALDACWQEGLTLG